MEDYAVDGDTINLTNAKTVKRSYVAEAKVGPTLVTKESVEVEELSLIQEAAASTPSPRYERSGLGEPEAQAVQNRLLALMDSARPYQDSELSLDDLAGRLDTTPHKLSEVLNSELGQSFYDFVNAYRVREVQGRIADGRSKHLTILSLAVDAGFSSKSTFNQVFKRHTGQTPSEYRKSVGG